MIYLLCGKIPEACPSHTPFFNYSRVCFVRRFDSAKWVQNVHTKSQNSALSILKVVTFNRNASKLQEKLWYLTKPDHYISSHYCRSGGLVCLICKFKTDRAVIGGGRKTFNLRSTTMDLFGCIFIKIAAAIPALEVKWMKNMPKKKSSFVQGFTRTLA